MNLTTCWMKQFSVIVPVYNEKAWIKDFLYSLYHQTRQPDEIIVVDGNSTDGTLEILEAEEEAGKITLASFPNNIAQARNYAIKQAKHEIILCTDAGCVVDAHRCEEIMKVYEHPASRNSGASTQVVGGKSDYIVKTEFQRFAKHRIASPDPDRHFVSSRNISFHKKIRHEVGGYPEYLTKRWEDTYFNYKIDHGPEHARGKAWHTIHYCPTAIVKWWMGNSIKDFYKMYRNYTQGDAEVFVIHGIMQSDSLKQAVKFLLVGLFLVWIMTTFHSLSLPIALLAILGIWMYKRSMWGFWFDLRFSLAKMRGMIVGMVKWLWKGLLIKTSMDIQKK